MHFVVKDKEHPYVQEKPFDWIRGYQTGGRSLLWARRTQRWSDLDFENFFSKGFISIQNSVLNGFDIVFWGIGADIIANGF